MPSRLVKKLLENYRDTGIRLGSRVYPVDAVPANAELPLIGYMLQSNVPEYGLTGAPCGYLATFTLTILAATYLDVTDIRAALPAALILADRDPDTGDQLTIGAGDTNLTFDGGELSDAGDQPQGPIDLNGRVGYVGDAQITFFYRVTEG